MGTVSADQRRLSRSLFFRRAVVVASLSALLGSLDTSVNIAFPAITEAFALDITAMQWIVVSHVLTYASLLLGCGRIADLWGHGRVLTCGLVTSALAFLGCGLAPTFAWLLVARVAQGFGAALVFGSAPALVTLAVPGEERGRALGIFQMSAAAGFAMGPLLGGVLVDGFGWRAVYLFRVLPALLLAWLVAGKLPPFREHQEAQRFDLLGALTLGGSVVALLLAVSRIRALGWTSPHVITLVLLSSACFAGFLVTETRVSAPVVNLGLFRRPVFMIANLLTLLANCARFAIWLLVPYYVIDVLRYPATIGGVLLLPAALMTTLASPLAGKVSDRLGTARLSSVGLGLEGLGLWMVSRLNAEGDYLSVAVALGVVGLGFGVFQVPNMSFVMGAIPRTQQGVAGSVHQMMRTLGILFGVTGASMLFDQRRTVYAEQLPVQGSTGLEEFVPAFQDVFLLSAGLCAVALGLSLLRGRETTSPRSAATEDCE